MNTTRSLSKDELRSEALQRREALSPEERAVASLVICNRVMDDDLFLDARGVHVYLPIGSEVDIKPLISLAWEMQKAVGLMRVMEDGGSVQFSITPQTTYRKTSLGILEPTNAELLDMNECDLVIAPMLAADEHCNRLGYGKGYYDQFLAQYPRPTIGVAFESQIYPELPTNESDIKVDAVYTELRVIGERSKSTRFNQ
jgi:5-formyltetrahydrofolate cyclo-ligase